MVRIRRIRLREDFLERKARAMAMAGLDIFAILCGPHSRFVLD